MFVGKDPTWNILHSFNQRRTIFEEPHVFLLRIRHLHLKGLKYSSRTRHSICWFLSCCGFQCSTAHLNVVGPFVVEMLFTYWGAEAQRANVSLERKPSYWEERLFIRSRRELVVTGLMPFGGWSWGAMAPGHHRFHVSSRPSRVRVCQTRQSPASAFGRIDWPYVDLYVCVDNIIISLSLYEPLLTIANPQRASSGPFSYDLGMPAPAKLRVLLQSFNLLVMVVFVFCLSSNSLFPQSYAFKVKKLGDEQMNTII